MGSSQGSIKDIYELGCGNKDRVLGNAYLLDDGRIKVIIPEQEYSYKGLDEAKKEWNINDCTVEL